MTEHDFVNALKDCWVGRQYKCAKVVLEVVKDDGKQVTFRTYYLTTNSKRITRDKRTRSKEEFKSYFQELEYRRIK